MTEQNGQLFRDGKKFISSRSDSKISKYSQDYIGQLCRHGKLECTRVGRVWYVSESSLLEHIQQPSLSSPQLEKASPQEAPANILAVKEPIALAPVVQSTHLGKDFSQKPAEEKGFSYFEDRKELLPVLPEEDRKISLILPKELELPARSDISGKISALVLSLCLTLGIFALAHFSQTVSVARSVAKSAHSTYQLAQHLTPEIVLGSTRDLAVDTGYTIASPYWTLVNRMNPVFESLSREAATFAAVVTSEPQGDTFFKAIARSVNRTVDDFFATFIKTPNTYVYVPESKSDSVPTKSPEATLVVSDTETKSQPQSSISGPVVQNFYSPIERVTEQVVISGVTPDELNRRLSELSNKFAADISTIAARTFGQSVFVSSPSIAQEIAHSQNIDQLTSTVITTPTISGGSITGAAISGGTISGATLTGAASFESLSVTGSATSTFAGGISATSLNATGASSTINGLVLAGGLGLLDLNCASYGSGGKLTTDANGNVKCSADISGGGGAGAWATSTDDLLVYPADIDHVVVIGDDATTTTGNIFEVVGNSKFGGEFLVTGSTTLQNITLTNATATNATSTSLFANIFRAVSGIFS